MKIFLLFVLTVIIAVGPALAAQPDNCVSCHQDWEEEDGPSNVFSLDVHSQRGLGCADCHGGDPALEEMDAVRESDGYRGTPDARDIPVFCARCHSDAAYMHEYNPSLPVDQLAKYRTSVHGQKLYSAGDTKVANCVSCHGVHQIGSARLPHSSVHPLNLPGTCGKCHADADYMAEYGIPTDQLSAYTESVHGQALFERKDLGAPVCNDCHGNHGAAPPGVASLGAVCGTCHAMEAELFAESPHALAFEENEFPMCETCHSNHAIARPNDSMIGSAEGSLCVDCHDHDDGTRGLVVADSALTVIQNLVTAHGQAATVLAEAREKGMMTTDEEFQMKEVGQLLIQTRTLIHAFNPDSITLKAIAGTAMADSVRLASVDLIDEYYYRRWGLGLATLFMSLLALLLYRKIRQLD